MHKKSEHYSAIQNELLYTHVYKNLFSISRQRTDSTKGVVKAALF
jgi:hypothetical protein